MPEEVYEEVYRLATLIAQAVSEADDEAEEFYYEQLRDYCLKEIDADRELPFLWETLGDFTREHRTAMRYYERALEVAERDSAPSHSILIAMGERYVLDGNRTLGREYLEAGFRQAFSVGDAEMSARADNALHRLTSD
ncbi:MAG: hypothetical protein ACT4NU_03240 [Chromatiales bacterium]